MKKIIDKSRKCAYFDDTSQKEPQIKIAIGFYIFQRLILLVSRARFFNDLTIF